MKKGLCGLGDIVLPPYCWLENYYKPLEARFPGFLEEQGHSEEAKALVASEREEIRMYERFGAYYGYGFYVGRKMD